MLQQNKHHVKSILTDTFVGFVIHVLINTSLEILLLETLSMALEYKTRRCHLEACN